MRHGSTGSLFHTKALAVRYRTKLLRPSLESGSISLGTSNRHHCPALTLCRRGFFLSCLWRDSGRPLAVRRCQTPANANESVRGCNAAGEGAETRNALAGLTALQHWMRRRLATDCADPE